MKLQKLLCEAKRDEYAVGAFNIFNHVSADATIRAAEELGSPVILQTSTSTIKRYGPKKLADMLLPLASGASVPVAVHLDHCTDPALAKACMEAGWDSIMIDASHFPLAENIRVTGDVVRTAHALGIDVEGELGTIEGVEDEISNARGSHADFSESLVYVEKTGIDAFAPAIGTAHGVYKGEPRIDFELVGRLAQATDCPIVIHGGTGLSEEVFRALIEKGACKINVSTALKHAYIDGMQAYLAENPTKADPLALDEAAYIAVREAVKRHIRIFKGLPEA